MRAFYGDTLGSAEGRSAANWIDFHLFGHQILVHLDPNAQPITVANPVDARSASH